VSEDNGNEILSVKPVEFDSFLVDRNRPRAIEISTGPPSPFNPQPLHDPSLEELSEVRSEQNATRACSEEQMGDS